MGEARRWLLAATLVAFLAFTPNASASVQFNVKGRWTCQDPSVGLKPIAGARAELWRSRSFYPDEKIKTVHLDGDGRYDMRISASDNFELYVKMLLTDDDGVSLENWYSPWTWKAETNKADSHSGVVNLGTYRISKDGSGSPKCAIWQGSHNAYGAYRAAVGAKPPNSFKVEAEYPCCGTPFTTLTAVHWPGGYDVRSNYSVPAHEFAHSFRHSFDGGYSHFLFDAARFQYPQTHEPCKHTNAGFAFNEGWAEYWAGSGAQKCGGNQFDSEYEGNVAFQLQQLEGCSSRAAMVRVLKAAPGKIHSFFEYENQWRSQLGKGPCGYTPLPPGTGGGKPPPPTTVPSQPEVLRQVRAQQRVVSSLRRRSRAAGRTAKRPGRCTKGGCEAALERLVAPAALSAQAKQADLVLDRLREGLAAARAAKFDPAAQYTLAARLDRGRDAFERANQAIVIAGMKDGLEAIDSRRGFGRARATDFVKTIRGRLTSLTRARKKGADTPASVENLFSAPESPLENVRRVSGR